MLLFIFLIDTAPILFHYFSMSTKSSGNFFSNLLATLFGTNDAEAEKKRQLKAISKKLAKSKFNKFYKFSGNECLPTLAKLFYEIYKAIFPMQAMFNSVQNPNLFKNLLIDYSTPEQIRKIEESLSVQKITELSKTIPLENLKKQAEQRLSAYSDYFTLEQISKIDTMYKQLLALKQFCTFDYYFFLKKFDKTLKENSFNTVPHFEKINAEYIADDLKDFVSIAWAIPFESDWSELFKVFKAYKGVEPIPLALWKKIMLRLQTIQHSHCFEMMIKLITANPAENVEIQMPSKNIVEPHIDQIRKEVNECLQTLTEKEKDTKTKNIANQLFGNSELIPIKNYTESENSVFSRKGLKTFQYTEALDYLKAFLIEIVKKDMREYYDVVIVRGQWESQSLSAPFSDGYNRLIMFSDKISNFDEELSEEAPIGMKIKNLLPKTERDNSARNILNRVIQDANDSAYSLIAESLKDIITIGKTIRTLIEDISKPKPTIVSNWKALEHFTDTPLKEAGVSLYKKIYLFTTLMKTCMME